MSAAMKAGATRKSQGQARSGEVSGSSRGKAGMSWTAGRLVSCTGMVGPPRGRWGGKGQQKHSSDLTRSPPSALSGLVWPKEKAHGRLVRGLRDSTENRG